VLAVTFPKLPDSVYYTLDPVTHLALPVFNLMQWALYMKGGNRRVAFDDIEGWKVSTVFLGVDHNFSDAGDPILFETMIFAPDAGGHDTAMDRYRTWAEARAGHERMKRGLLADIAAQRITTMDRIREIMTDSAALTAALQDIQQGKVGG
jgi:hypothetical protein